MYKEYLFKLQPLTLELYEQLDFPKIKIDANVPYEDSLQKAGETFKKMATVHGTKIEKNLISLLEQLVEKK